MNEQGNLEPLSRSGPKLSAMEVPPSGHAGKVGGVRRTLATNMGARLVTLPVSVLCALLGTRLLLQHYTVEEFAYITLVGTIFLLIPFADLGLGAAIINTVSDSRSSADDILRMLRRTITFLFGVGILIVVLDLAVYSFVGWNKILGIGGMAKAEFSTATTVAIAIFALTLPLGVGQRYLTGAGLNHLTTLTLGAASPVSLAVTFLVIHLDADAPVAALGPVVGIWFSGVIATAIMCVKSGMGVPRPCLLRQIRARELLSLGAPMLIILIGIPVAFQSQRTLLAHFSSVKSLAEYSLSMQLYNPLWSLISTTAISLWPIFNSRRNLRGGLGKLFFRAGIFLLLVGMIAAIGVVALGPQVANIITGGTIALPMVVLASLGLLLLIQSLQQAPGMFLTRKQELRFQSSCVALMLLASVGISLLLIPRMGAAGPLIAVGIGIFAFQFLPGLWRVLKTIRHESDSVNAADI